MSKGAKDIERLFRKHAGYVARFLVRLGVPPSEVEDQVQEVFIVAYKKGGFDPARGNPRSWLGAIAVRVASTARRTVARRREDPESKADVIDLAAVGRLEAREALHRVGRALQKMDVEHRTVFALFEIQGESAVDIAAALGVPVGTVYSRLHSARARFKDIYSEMATTAPAGDKQEAATLQ